jgi:hypothetical protein
MKVDTQRLFSVPEAGYRSPQCEHLRAGLISFVIAIVIPYSLARTELRRRTAVGVLLRFDFVALPCPVFVGLRLVMRSRLT